MDLSNGITSNFLQASVVASTFMAGVLASPHCLSMCGPLTLAIGTNQKRVRLQQIGRGIGYIGLGAAAGAVGPSWKIEGSFSTFSRFTLLAIALTVIFSATKLVFKGNHEATGNWFSVNLARLWVFIHRHARKAPNTGAFVAGVASFLLPCGQLYIFAAAALASGSATAGATVLGLFWLGTLPSFFLGPAIVKRWLGPWAARMPKTAATLLLIAGLSSVALFVRNLDHAPASASTPAHQHGEAERPRCH